MADDKTSIWKKEINLRAPKAERAEKAAAKAAAKREAADQKKAQKLASRAEKKAATPPAPTASAQADEKTSVWKKEISFRRKPKPAQAAPAVAPAEVPAAAPATEKTSIWKKEISFRRKPTPAAGPVVAQAPLPAPAVGVAPVTAAPTPHRVEPVVAPEPEPVAEATTEPEPVASSVIEQVAEVTPAPEPVLPAAPVHLTSVPDPEPVAHESQSVEDLIAELSKKADEEDARLAQQSDDEHDAVPSAPDVSPAPVLLPAPDPIVHEEDTLALPPAAEVAPAPAPAPAPEQEPQPEPEFHYPEPEAEFVTPVAAAAPPVSLPEPEPQSEPEFHYPVPEPVAEVSPVEETVVAEPVAEPEPLVRTVEAKKKRSLFGSRGKKDAAASSAPKAKRDKKHQAKKVVGVKIGASQIAAARISNNGSVEVQQIVREPLEPGIVVAGEVRDPEALAAALKRFFKKHKLPRRGIRLGVSNNRIGVRVLEISGIEGNDQLRNAVRFRAQEVLPIPVNEAVLDFQVVGESQNENGEAMKRIVLVVAYRDLVERYAAAFRKAGLKLMGIDLEAFALLRALSAGEGSASQDERSGLVVVAVGHDRSTFAVSDGEVCEFTRVLDWGGSSLDEAVANALELSVTEAHQVKLGLSLADATVVPENLTDEQAHAAREAIRRAVEGFARDLVSSLRFYQSQPDSLGIRELVLSGGTSELPGLAEELERLLDVRVRIGDPLGRVKVGRRVKQREQLGSLAAAIGLGIED
jgi:type IV pilus assembly protein PilM